MIVCFFRVFPFSILVAVSSKGCPGSRDLVTMGLILRNGDPDLPYPARVCTLLQYFAGVIARAVTSRFKALDGAIQSGAEFVHRATWRLEVTFC